MYICIYIAPQPNITYLSPGCKGGINLIPVHWEELCERDKTSAKLSTPCVVLTTDFFHSLPIEVDESENEHRERERESVNTSGLETEFDGSPFRSRSLTSVSVNRAGLVTGVLLWWKVCLIQSSCYDNFYLYLQPF